MWALRFTGLQPLLNTILTRQLRAIRTHTSVVSLAGAYDARKNLNGTV
jgi:molybdopterin biosynthesis enzyme MoaB